MPTISGKTAIRPAAPGDYPVIAELFRELNVGEELVPYERFCTEMLAETIVAEDRGAIVGFAYYRPAREVVHLGNLVTAPRFRGRGIGRMLMAEVIDRAKKAQCSAITLNVMPTNTPAIRLYERSGLAPIRTNRHLKLLWSLLDALPPSAAPFIGDVMPIEPQDDEALERDHDLPLGLLAARRAAPDRSLRVLRGPGTATTLGVYDPGFGLVSPFRAPDLPHALSLLFALRRLACAGPAHVLLSVEGQPALADSLFAIGATLRFDTLFMRGSLSASPS